MLLKGADSDTVTVFSTSMTF